MNSKIAFDRIDKIDRNLFERNCDVQAWATFDAIKDCLINPTEESKKIAQAFMKIYMKSMKFILIYL